MEISLVAGLQGKESFFIGMVKLKKVILQMVYRLVLEEFIIRTVLFTMGNTKTVKKMAREYFTILTVLFTMGNTKTVKKMVLASEFTQTN